MPQYSREQVETTRESFRNLKYRNCEFELLGRRFNFFEVPQERNPSLPGFAFVLAGRKGEDYVIGVSNLVEEAFRPLWAFHEYVEVVEPGADNRIRCIDALRQEIDASRALLSSADQFPRYIEARRVFFENLIKYVQERPNHYNSGMIAEFQESLEHLVRIKSGL